MASKAVITHSGTTLLDVCAFVSRTAHMGQVYNDEPYIFHPFRVALRLKGNVEAQAVALLHDVFEDSELFTAEELHNKYGIPRHIIDAAIELKREKGIERYEEYIHRLSESDNPLVVLVKYADLLENTAQLPFLAEEHPRRAVTLGKRYAAAIAYLLPFVPADAHVCH